MIREWARTDTQSPVHIRALRYGSVSGTIPGQQVWLWL